MSVALSRGLSASLGADLTPAVVFDYPTVASLANSGTLALGTGGTLTLSSGSSTLGGTITGSGTIVIGPGARVRKRLPPRAPVVDSLLHLESRYPHLATL